ncbi:MAG: amino acid transporter [Desulfovibrio sp.]|nr:MAG: amino acid transporter [Desulfovibrio sp.]
MSITMSYLQGMGIGAGQIIAIGAQNAFVLSQSIRRNHHLTVCLVCTLCDAALITLGVLGAGSLVASNPALLRPAALAGALFLAWYGLTALRSAVQGGALRTEETGAKSVRSMVLLTLTITLLNPHVYLDTVVMLGSISGQYPGMERYLFGLGAVTASVIWFFTLGFGGRALAPLFRKPVTWRVLDGLVCVTMWGIAALLVTKALESQP